MDITVKQGDNGVSWAIKRQLIEDGVDVKNINSCWTQIMKSFEGDNESKVQNGDTIGEKWTSLNANVKIAVNDTIKIADTTWKKIVDIVTKKSVSKSQESDKKEKIEKVDVNKENQQTNSEEAAKTNQPTNDTSQKVSELKNKANSTIGIQYTNGNHIKSESESGVFDSDAEFKIGDGKYNLERYTGARIPKTLDYGDLKSNGTWGLINTETGKLNPNCKLFQSNNKIKFSGEGELNGATVLVYKGKVAVELNGKKYDLNILLQQNKKVEIQ